MKTGIFFLVACLFSTLMYAQVALTPNFNELYANNGVQISSQKKDCINTANGTAIQYVMLTVWNKQENSINVSFKKEMWFDNKCSNCTAQSAEHTVTVNLEGNSVLRASCSTENRNLRIFSKMLELKNVRELTHYELKNIEIETVD